VVIGVQSILLTMTIDLAAVAAAQHTDPEVALPLLVEALGDEDAGVREAAAAVLGQFGEAAAPAVSSLVVALGDEDELVVWGAAGALAAIGPKAHPAVDALICLLADPAEGEFTIYIRISAVEALRRIGKPAEKAISLLTSLVPGRSGESEDAFWLRLRAAHAVLTFGGHHEAAVAVVAEGLGHPEWWLRAYAEEIDADIRKVE
jgi:HEAT repeat protein